MVRRIEAAFAEVARRVRADDAGLRERLTDFVQRERGLRDWVAGGRKGQSVGREPSITPSVLRELEHMLRDTPLTPTEIAADWKLRGL